jgi:hypothetical protein
MFQRQACLLSEPAEEWLQQSREARVLAVFERACNLVNEKGQLLALIAPELGMGPFALMVEVGNGRFTDCLTGDTRVTIRAGEEQLQVGPLLIQWSGTPLWQPRPAWKAVRTVSLAPHHPPLRHLLLADAPADSLAGILAADRSASNWPATPLLLTARPAVQLLQQGLTAGEQSVCATAAQALAGLGGGLTPAGDDFLVGVIYALWACRPSAQAAPLAAAIAGAAAPLTTTLSAGWLAAAGRGEAGIAWHDLIKALATGRPQALQRAARAVLATGHTSGADALAGFLVGLACLAGGRGTSISPPPVPRIYDFEGS